MHASIIRYYVQILLGLNSSLIYDPYYNVWRARIVQLNILNVSEVFTLLSLGFQKLPYLSCHANSNLSELCCSNFYNQCASFTFIAVFLHLLIILGLSSQRYNSFFVCKVKLHWSYLLCWSPYFIWSLNEVINILEQEYYSNSIRGKINERELIVNCH